MPYKFKGKRDCTQSDGKTKGKYLTVKKDGSRRCYKSEKQYKAAQAWAHEADDIPEEDTLKLVREFISHVLSESVLFVNDIPVSVEIADSSELRSAGLMNRDSLPHNSGMLFCFPDCRERSFWMKDTEIPLSIAYADDTGKIVSIKDMVPLSKDSVRSDFPASYALEMNKGWFAANGIRVGDRLGGRYVK